MLVIRRQQHSISGSVPGVIEAYKCFLKILYRHYNRSTFVIDDSEHRSLEAMVFSSGRKTEIESGSFKCIDDAVAISEEERLAHRDE